MHAWRFDLTTGENVNGGGGLRVYAVREVEGGVWVRSHDID
jgi:nitrite reductase/ring-hydroxylating ferredoxin subunit